jgi:hypothetical protein
VARKKCGAQVVIERKPVPAARVAKVLGLLWVGQQRRLGMAQKKCGPWVVLENDAPKLRARVEKLLWLLWAGQRRRLGVARA